MNHKIKIILFAVFLFFSCVEKEKKDNGIYYLLGEEISELISVEIKRLEDYHGYKSKNAKYWVLDCSRSNKQPIVLLLHLP